MAEMEAMLNFWRIKSHNLTFSTLPLRAKCWKCGASSWRKFSFNSSRDAPERRVLNNMSWMTVMMPDRSPLASSMFSSMIFTVGSSNRKIFFSAVTTGALKLRVL